LLDKQPGIQVEGGVTMDKVDGVIDLKDIVFRYPSRLESLILDRVSLSLAPGSIVALVGHSGGGKSTIVSLVSYSHRIYEPINSQNSTQIERFYDPIEGEVLLDGVNIKTLDPIWYRRQIGFVSQEPVLFACSIKENISYGGVNT